MTTSAEKPFLSDLIPGGHPSEFLVGYLVSSLMNSMHEAVLDEFIEQGITKATLAKRIDADAALVNRWLSGPSNWTLETLGKLLAGLECELDFHVVKLRPAAATESLSSDLLSNEDRNTIPSLGDFIKRRASPKQGGNAQGQNIGLLAA